MQVIEQNGYSRQEILDVLTGKNGSRFITFYYNLMSKLNQFKFVLKNIQGGSIECDYTSDIFATAKFKYYEGTNETIDFQSDRIQPVVRISLPAKSDTYENVVNNTIPTKLVRYRLDSLSGSSELEAFRGTASRVATIGSGITIAQPPLVTDGGRSAKGSKTATANTSQITVSNSADWLNGLDRITIVIWISNPVLSINEIQGIAGFYNTLGNDFGLSISYREKGTVVASRRNVIQAVLNIGSSTLTFESSSYALGAVADTIGHCFVFNWQSGIGAKMFLDGQNIYGSGINEFVVGGLKSSANIRFGGDGYSANKAFDGYIDDISMYAQSIDIYPAADLYQCGKKVGKYGSINYAEWKQGIFVLSSPARNIDDGTKVYRQIDAYDISQVLLTDQVPNRYYVDVNTRYTTAVIEILSKTVGIYNPTPGVYNDLVANVTHTTVLTPAVLEWEPGTSKLQIINDLLAGCGYEKIWFNHNGVPQILPYILPQNRVVEYTYRDDQYSVMLPEIEQVRDYFNLPNKWVAVVSDPDKPLLTASYTNNDPSDPTSVPNVGRTIVSIISEDQAADLNTIQLHVQQAAFLALSQLETVSFKTGIMPFHQFGDYAALTRKDIAIADNYFETAWSFELLPGSQMAHKVSKIINLNPSFVGTL